MKYKITLVTAIILNVVQIGYGQTSEDTSGKAAFIFAYYPKEGLKGQFEDGYKKHLSWHKQKKDPLPWFAWYVKTGDRLGLFIDGTFGISFQAYDNRVDITGDAANFVKTTAPFVDDVFRKVYVLKDVLSTTHLLEDDKPSESIEVYSIILHPGTEPKFERAIERIKENTEEGSKPVRFTLYKLISGGKQPGYMLMAPRNNFAYFDNISAVTSFGNIIQQNFKEEEAAILMNKLHRSIKSIKGETWGYRPDLSSLPGD